MPSHPCLLAPPWLIRLAAGLGGFGDAVLGLGARRFVPGTPGRDVLPHRLVLLVLPRPALFAVSFQTCLCSSVAIVERPQLHDRQHRGGFPRAAVEALHCHAIHPFQQARLQHQISRTGGGDGAFV